MITEETPQNNDEVNTSEDVDVNREAEIEASVQMQNEQSLLNSTSESSADENPKSETKEESPTRPDYWPEEYWDKESNEPKLKDFYDKYQKTEKMAEDFRKILSKKDKEGAKAEVPESYEFELVDENFTGNKAEIDIYGKAAREAGLSNEQANILLSKFWESQQERIAEDLKAEKAKLGEGADDMIMGIKNFIDTRVKNRTFTTEEAEALSSEIRSAEAAKAFSKIITMTGEQAIPTKVRMTSEGMSKSDISRQLTEALRKQGPMAPDSQEVLELRKKLQELE